MATVLYANRVGLITCNCFPPCCVDAEAKLECPLQGESLGSDYGDPGLPSLQNPPLVLADEIQRSASITFGTRLAAGVAGGASG